MSSTTIELSFGGGSGKGGAWDDRELIRASEAAMKEFHIHHPGPGSWLDKATAALAAGRKLPGAEDYGTAWYSASLPSEAESSTHPTAASSSTPLQNATQNHNKKRKSRETNGNGNSNSPYHPQAANSTSTFSSTANPYVPTAQSQDKNKNKKQRFASPSYQPPSPSANEDGEVGEEDEDGDEDEEDDEEEEEEDDYDEQAEWGEADWEVQDYYPDSYPDPDQDQEEAGYDHYPYQGQGGCDDAQYAVQGGDESYTYFGGGGGGPSDQMGWVQAPSFGPQQPQPQQAAGVGREEALSYAMTAQYWAGYWMGVAQGGSAHRAQGQSRAQEQRQGQRQRRIQRAAQINRRRAGKTGRSEATTSSNETGVPRGSFENEMTSRQGQTSGPTLAPAENGGQGNGGDKEISNVFITQKRFNRSTVDGLRR
ncbi:hypothetical protein I317_04094 [Kwoniella heveanensis CBS 569]|nr:hypothetical protein I317_04094 [Kwoniella heveanensis CBS 569]